MGEARRKMEQMIAMGGRNGQQQQQINIDLSTAKQLVCKICGGNVFQPAATLHEISAIMSPTGQRLVAQQTVLVCINCKAVMKLDEEKTVDMEPSDEKPAEDNNVEACADEEETRQ